MYVGCCGCMLKRLYGMKRYIYLWAVGVTRFGNFVRYSGGTIVRVSRITLLQMFAVVNFT